MDAILFSANPTIVTIDDAIRHLGEHDELYWEVGFRLKRDNFSYPMLGFIHISGGQVEYQATIRDVVSFSVEHYEGDIAERVKPEPWRLEWRDNYNNVRSYPWKTALVMTQIVPFSYDTYAFRKIDGNPIQGPPRSYIRVLCRDDRGSVAIGSAKRKKAIQRSPTTSPLTSHPRIAERNLEEFVVQQLTAIETGLRLVHRQLATPAGRLDLLCQDAAGNWVVVELKREQGTDQVVGQVLRYMGWVKEHHRTDKVRGIIIVGKKDQALTYAVKAAPNVQVKEFKLFIE